MERTMKTTDRNLRLKAASLVAFTLILMLGIVATSIANPGPENIAPGRTMAQQATKKDTPWITVDHTKLELLQKPFRSGVEVTQACLSCHSEADDQLHGTIHWTWLAHQNETGTQMGKAGYSLNNFCISANKTEDKGCMSCHPGWGTETEAINCLVCHGQKTINWDEAFEDLNAFLVDAKEDPEAKDIADEIQADIQAAVQDIGSPTRKNCGTCHFYGGGGDGVKHGDLDTSLVKPNKALDVHMGVDGQNFDCIRCHTTERHNIAGRIYTAPAYTDRKSLVEDDLTSKITCESCHTALPHKTESKANDHTDKVACQSCHIPMFARVNPTKMSWDWSQSGNTKDGKPYKTKGAFGKYEYLSIKGKMEWKKNVEPEYYWFNGSIKSLTASDPIDPSGTVRLSYPMGDRSDENARIFPFKTHRGVQPYDKIHKTLLAPILGGNDGYWKTLDWQKALTKGSKALDLPYSGEFDFVDTTYVFPTTHMVAPKDNVVACKECHTKEGRLANLGGFYMPGRDANRLLNVVGWGSVLAALIGVLLHGTARMIRRK
jgi:octaheme c-type cytochrome (tetrathionate reductase family)